MISLERYHFQGATLRELAREDFEVAGGEEGDFKVVEARNGGWDGRERGIVGEVKVC